MTIEYLLLDLPSDHEVEDNIVTECDVIRAIVSNKNQGKKVRTFRATTAPSFTGTRRGTKYVSVEYVHLAGHGNSRGLGMIDGSVAWECVARQITTFVKKLPSGKKRILCVSCCHSRAAVQKMSSGLRGYFSGIYYFHDNKIDFATAMTVWAMFYHTKDVAAPFAAVTTSVNRYFEGTPLKYKRLQPAVAA